MHLLQVAARILSKQLASPPIELALVEASVRVFRQIPASEDADSPAASFAGVVPAAVVTFLRRRVGNFTEFAALLETPLRCAWRSPYQNAVCNFVRTKWTLT